MQSICRLRDPPKCRSPDTGAKHQCGQGRKDANHRKGLNSHAPAAIQQRPDTDAKRQMGLDSHQPQRHAGPARLAQRQQAGQPDQAAGQKTVLARPDYQHGQG